MKSKLFFLAVVLFVPVLILSTSPVKAADGLLDATEDWNDPSTNISWIVSYDDTSSLWHYSYTFTYPTHDPSYFIFEVSDGFGDSNISNVKVEGSSASYEINTFTPKRENDTTKGGKYQTMPEEIYGVKIEVGGTGSTGGSYTVEFDSTNAPEWGDFYARCGSRPAHEDGSKQWNSAWNYGFTGDDNTPGLDDTDPVGTVYSGSNLNHLLVPDTATGGSVGESYTGSLAVVPEPVSTTLFIIGGGMLAGRRFMRKKK